MAKDNEPDSAADIRAKHARMIKVFESRPDAAFGTKAAHATVGAGLRCDFTQGDETAVMDMPEIMGGTNTGPTPGFYARAGIAGCLGIGIKMTAINQGLDLAAIDIAIETDFDDAAMFGLGPNTAAPLETRLAITLTSDEPEDALRALVDTAMNRDPWFLALRDAQKVVTDLTLTR